MADQIDLDHVAVAVERRHDAWPRYRVDLGGRWASWGESVGFALNQLAYDNAMRVEILRPHRADENDFLRRFLDRRGPGPHHLTFKVPDIEDALGAAERAGYPPVNVDLSDPFWKEAFLHPKVAHGVVVQLAEAHDDGWEPPAPAPDFPAARPARPAVLERVVHQVPSIAAARRLYTDILGGTVADEGDGWVELAWPGPGRIRLDECPDDGGRIHHLAFAVDQPAAIPDARPVGDGTWIVAPEDNLGTRLVLSARTP